MPTDPARDGGRSWDDRHEQRWDLVAAAAAAVGDALTAGTWTPRPHPLDDEDPSMVRGAVTLQVPADLTETEREIIRSWFIGLDETVRFDPWAAADMDIYEYEERPADVGEYGTPANGRHRLWATLPHFGRWQVPVQSDVLVYATPPYTNAVGPDWHESFQDSLFRLQATGWFDTSDPINQRFAESIAAAAHGTNPQQA